MSDLQCQRCGKKTDQLQNIDSVLAERLQALGGESYSSSQVCPVCFTQLVNSVNQSSGIHAQDKAKEQKKLALWKSRVNYIKAARTYMDKKSFADAAVQYEKYLKVLEMVFDTKTDQLAPEMFKESARTQELTAVAGVYWDLLRIYDANSKYESRMKVVATKLGLFLRYTPVYPDIVRKAEAFVKTANNPSIVKGFLKSAGESKGRCFIASSAFGSEGAPEVMALRGWREDVLLKTCCGRVFVRVYYGLSPGIARILDNLPFLKIPVRAFLRLFINRAIRHRD